MKNKGFTLIELLAVIVILAIIALIATPIILNIIEDTREESKERSVDMYGDAVNNAVLNYELNEKKQPTEFNQIEKYIKYSGSEVQCGKKKLYNDGSVFLASCSVGGQEVEDYSYGTKKEPALLDKTDDDFKESGFEVGDVIIVGEGENAIRFRVMSWDENTITTFSEKSAGEYYPTTYEQDLVNYKTELEKLGLNNSSVSLMTLEQAELLGCRNNDCTDAPEWLISKEFFLVNNYFMSSSKSLVSCNFEYGDNGIEACALIPMAIKPVVTISIKDIL